MPARGKILFFFFFAAIMLLVLPKTVFAQVVINEFQVKPDQWIELYNKGESSVDISGWTIDDSGGTEKYVISSVILPSKKCVSFQSGKFNWNTASGDTVKLLDSSFALKEEYVYSLAPGEGVSIGRVIDGEGDLFILSSSSRDKFNANGENCLTLTSTPTPTLKPTATPIQTPTDAPAASNTPTPVDSPEPTATQVETSTATYKINEVKNEEGDTLSSVKIYVDGGYIHHYPPETLEFCEGCYCYNENDEQVSCGFGEHTIKLEKSGYQDWTEIKTINTGDSYEVNPVMTSSSDSSPTSTPTPTSTPAPTLTKTPTPTKKLSPTPTPDVFGDVLGATEEGSLDFLENEASNEYEEDSDLKPPVLWPKLLIGLGLMLIFGAAYPLWLPKLKIVYNQIVTKT